MSPLKSNRLAWSLTFASLALWASSAPVTWGQVAAGATSLLGQTADEGSNTSTTTVDIQQGDTTIAIDDGTAQVEACPTAVLPPDVTQVVPVTPVPPAVSADGTGTFHICGPDAGLESEIAALIGGRGFSATLASHGGCADLTIRPTSQLASGSSSSNLSVSLGSGRNLQIQITSEHGATRATIALG
jgi:hypothetical protein